MPSLTRCIVCTASLLLLLSSHAVAQQQGIAASDDVSRLKIGLVLGGGGARGAAHIGVLKELERLQIPIDAIAGTSMGAIVGGLYATGVDAQQLEELVSSLDWAAALTDSSARESLSFRRKQDDREFPVKLELGLRGTDLVLPKGVIQGHKLDLLLRELTLSSSHITDFDELAIPFRAIASDIVAGEAVVLEGGDLAHAIRASMSVPGAFAPIVIDGKVLVDGGLTGNLPVDVVRGLGVDIVIAVDVEFPLYSSEELGSVLTISEQMLTVLIRKETLRQIETLESNDVLIRPDLGIFASTNFGEICDAIGPGRDATVAVEGRLKELSLSNEAWQAHVHARQRSFDDQRKLAFVRVKHDGKLSPRVLESRLSVSAGDPIDSELLASNADQLYGLQLYKQVDYRLVEENGELGVEYRATAKGWGPNFLQFGVSLEDDFEGATRFNLSTRMTRSGLNRLGAEWRTDLQLGTDPTLISEFYQPLSFDSRWFFAPRFELRQSNLNAFALDETIARYRLSESELSVDVGRELGTIGEIRLGVYRGIGDASLKVGDPVLPDIDYQTGGVLARLRIDSQDNARFPRKGMLADIQWNLSRTGFGADNRFDIISADLSQTWSRGKSSVELGMGYATTLRSDNTVQDFFPLGGFLRLSGLERGEISGPHSGLVRAIYYRQIGETTGGILQTPLYLGASIEAGNVWADRSDMSFDTMLMNGSLFVGMDSFFGAIYLAAGFGEEGQRNFYLFIGTPPR